MAMHLLWEQDSQGSIPWLSTIEYWRIGSALRSGRRGTGFNSQVLDVTLLEPLPQAGEAPGGRDVRTLAKFGKAHGWGP